MPDPARPREGRCPRCGKCFPCVSVADHKPFPFCSDRCRDIDLGNWLTGKYVIPGPPVVKNGEDEIEEEPPRPQGGQR